jgi:peptidoglycan hydrolase-like protein with peptidoglycan-binding domain
VSILGQLRSLAIQLFTTSNTNDRPLSIGSNGTDVWALQVLLIIDNTGPQAAKLGAVGPTGTFGALTQAAVAEYQKVHGVTPAAGYVGAKTKTALFGTGETTSTASVSQSTPTTTSVATAAAGPFAEDLSFGSTGSEVSILQRFLAEDPATYPQGSITGYYGLATEQAVQRFQLENGIPVSQDNYGSVDAITGAALNSLYVAGKTP